MNTTTPTLGIKDEKPLHIVELYVENFKKISTALITPNGTLVEINGENGNGKSSVLDAIWTLIEGASVAPVKPIKTGAERAIIRAKMGDLIATRVFRKTTKKDGSESVTTEVRVENADGSKYDAPQRILDSFFDELTLDPTEFERMSDKDKFDALKKFVPDFDFEKSAALTAGDVDKRKDINRRHDEAKAGAALISFPDDTPAEAISEADIITELENASTVNLGIEQAKNALEDAATRIIEIDRARVEATASRERTMDNARQRVAEIMSEAERLCANSLATETARDVERAELQSTIDTAPPLAEPADAAAIRGRLDRARLINLNVAKKASKADLVKKAEELDNESRALTAGIQAREKLKQDAIKNAALPVPGLGFGDGVILFNGEPFDQASQADRIKTSAAIAMASNPRLRILRIRNGNDLSKKSMAVLTEMAAAQNFQVWCERIESSGTMGFVLEDGKLKEQPKLV